MDLLLKFLILRMNTVDGVRDSGLAIINKLRPEQKHLFMFRTLMRFKVLRMRMKISYMAFQKKMTVSQLIQTTILKAHDDLTKEGSIPLYDPFLREKIETFDKLLDIENQEGSFKNITKVNTIQVGNKGIKIDRELRQIVEGANTSKINIEEDNIQKDIKIVFNKNSCQDIFKNSKVDGEHIYEPMLNSKRIQHKLQLKKYLRVYLRILLILSLRAVDKVLMIRARLKQIEIQKRMFVLEVEQGQECYIP